MFGYCHTTSTSEQRDGDSREQLARASPVPFWAVCVGACTCGAPSGSGRRRSDESHLPPPRCSGYAHHPDRPVGCDAFSVGCGFARKYGDAVPALLAVPDRAIPSSRIAGSGNLSSGTFSFCRQTISGSASASQRLKLAINAVSR